MPWSEPGQQDDQNPVMPRRRSTDLKRRREDRAGKVFTPLSKWAKIHIAFSLSLSGILLSLGLWGASRVLSDIDAAMALANEIPRIIAIVEDKKEKISELQASTDLLQKQFKIVASRLEIVSDRLARLSAALRAEEEKSRWPRPGAGEGIDYPRTNEHERRK